MSTAECDVVIVGAGFSGLVLSLFLKEQGLRSIILEKSDRIGGRARTLYCEGNTLELGTCYLARDYQKIAALAQRLGLSEKRLGNTSAHPQSRLSALYNKSRSGYVAELCALLATLCRYAARRRSALSQFETRHPDAYGALAMPISDWLRHNRCARLEPIFSGLVDIFGYGPMTTMPALYALRWMTPDMILTAFLNSGRLVAQGFGEFAARMAAQAEIRLSSEIVGSHRTADAHWTVSTPAGDLRARHVVVACPPLSPDLIALFDEPRRQILERDVLFTRYVSVAVIARNWFTSHRRALLRGEDHRDHVMGARRDGDRADGSSYFVCYLYPTIAEDAHIASILRRDIKADGGELQEIIEFGHWYDYMTRLSGDAIAAGRYFALEDGQGVDNVWLCNAMLAHENWRDLLVLSRNIADGIAATGRSS